MRKREQILGTKSVLLGSKVTGKSAFSKEDLFHCRFFSSKETMTYSDEVNVKNEAESFVWEPWLKPPEKPQTIRYHMILMFELECFFFSE